MEEKFFVDPYLIKIGLRDFEISRNGKRLTIKPPNAEDLINLLLDVMKIESLPVLPSTIARTPYVVHFELDRTFFISEEDSPEKVLCSFDEGDTLISAVKLGSDKWLDLDRLNEKSGAPTVLELGSEPPY